MSVDEDSVLRPDGSPGIYGTIHIKPGISVLPIDDEMHVYLVQEFKYPLGRISIETVGAGIDDGESPLQAAQRELKEELGLVAAEWQEAGIVFPVTSFIDSSNHLFIARSVAVDTSRLEATEEIEPLKVPLKTALNMVMNNEISEQKSCCLILRAALIYMPA